MTRTRRSRTKGSAKNQAKSQKTRRYQKDVDQVHEEIQRQAQGLTRNSKLDTTVQEADPEELAGGGDFPCIPCSRHFISTEALDTHAKTKLHKRRLKQLKEEPYTQREAELAAGLGVDNRRRDAGRSVKADSRVAEADMQ